MISGQTSGELTFVASSGRCHPEYCGPIQDMAHGQARNEDRQHTHYQQEIERNAAGRIYCACGMGKALGTTSGPWPEERTQPHSHGHDGTSAQPWTA